MRPTGGTEGPCGRAAAGFGGCSKPLVKRYGWSQVIPPASSVLTARQIRDFRMHKHMSKPGIYMMLGDPTDKKPEVYIGQAKRRKNGNGTIHRITEHIDRGEHP